MRQIDQAEQAMPCFRDFDRTNFACTLSCGFRTVCAEHTPLEIDIRAGIKKLEEVIELEDVEEVIEPATIKTEPATDVKKTKRKKQKSSASSRFDIIEISNENSKDQKST